jgi:hypothetical protein
MPRNKDQRRAWTKQDLAAVTQGLKKGLSVKQIAKKIGRTEGAIRQKQFDRGESAAQKKKKGATQRGRGRGHMGHGKRTTGIGGQKREAA